MNNKNSPASGTRLAAKDTHLPLRSADSIAEMKALPVAFDIVTAESGESADGLQTPTKSRSFTTYDQLMRNESEHRRTLRTAESLAELGALPAVEESHTRTPTLNKKLHSRQSQAELCSLPELRKEEEGSGGPALCNSDYAYFPPVLRNSDYAYDYGDRQTPTIRNSSYCYVNPDGTSRFSCCHLDGEEKKPAKSPGNPYVHVERYRMNQPPQPQAAPSDMTVGSERIPSAIFYSDYQFESRITVPPRAPATKTLNKRLRGAVSEDDIAQLGVSFHSTRTAAASSSSSSQDIGLEVIRDWCRESLEDLYLLPSLSSYQLEQPDSGGLSTARNPLDTNCLCLQTARSGGNSKSHSSPTSGANTAKEISSEDQMHYYPEALARRSR